MTNKDEAIHKALKVLNCLNNDRVYETAWVKGAINACEEALEQPTVAELNNEYLRDTNVIGLEQPAQEHLTRAQQVIRANNSAQLLTRDWKETIDERIARDSEFKQALEQPAEPRLVSYALDGSTCTLNIDGEEVYFNREQPAQEPVELEEALKHCNGKDCDCYAYYEGECACDADWTPEEVIRLRYQLKNTHPHQWQGLTDDEIQELTHYDIKFARAIEQSLREKNT